MHSHIFFSSQATSLGLLGGRGRGRFGLLARARGRGCGRGGRIPGIGLSVDHRPRTLEIIGFAVEQSDEVVQFFAVSQLSVVQTSLDKMMHIFIFHF